MEKFLAQYRGILSNARFERALVDESGVLNEHHALGFMLEVLGSLYGELLLQFAEGESISAPVDLFYETGDGHTFTLQNCHRSDDTFVLTLRGIEVQQVESDFVVSETDVPFEVEVVINPLAGIVTIDGEEFSLFDSSDDAVSTVLPVLLLFGEVVGLAGLGHTMVDGADLLTNPGRRVQELLSAILDATDKPSFLGRTFEGGLISLDTVTPRQVHLKTASGRGFDIRGGVIRFYQDGVLGLAQPLVFLPESKLAPVVSFLEDYLASL